MTDNINLTSKIRLKTNPIFANSMCLLKQKKSVKLFIAHTKGIYIYDSQSQKFEEVKIGQNAGVLSCLGQSDDLVFFCFGMKILACGSNGKILYDCDTFLAIDKIDAIHIYGYQLWLVASNMVSQFVIGGTQLNNKQSRITQTPQKSIEDVNSQIYDVKINHSLLFKIDAQKPFLLLLKHNNQIQTFDKKDNAVFVTESPPTYGYVYPAEHNNNRILVGTMGGEILYLQVERKKIKKLWSIKQNSQGRVNCIVEVRNGFIVFRDECIEMWNQNRQFLGRQITSQKVLSAIYLSEQQSLFYGTNSGQVVEMFNYEKMMKLAKDRNDLTEKNKLVKEIEQLRKVKADLKLKVDKLGGKTESKSGKHIKISVNLAVDYSKFCYCLELVSPVPIIKLMMKGDITLLGGHKILFEGKLNNDNRVYMLGGEQKKSLMIRFDFAERYHENEKLLCTIYNDLEGKLIAQNITVELKLLCLHQKIQSKLHNRENLRANVLKIEGEFKYFQMTAWLNTIFNDFGSPSLELEQISLCYESLITKNKIFIEYKDRSCLFYSQAPTPLSIIKKTIFQKAKEKQLSLNYDTKTNLQGLTSLLKKMGPRLKSFELNKKQFQLLPGLLQLQHESISPDLKEILSRSQDIKSKNEQASRQYTEMKSSIKEFYINYRSLNNKEVNNFQVEELVKLLENFQVEKIIKLIDS